MKEQKQTYLSPVTETLVVRFEGRILTGSNEGLGDDPINGGFGED